MPIVPLHLGALHPFETALVLAVAFGPFLVLAFVVVRQRRRTSDTAAGAGEGAAGRPRDAPGRSDVPVK